MSAESADSDESAESARQGDLAGRSVGGMGRSRAGDGRRRRWQRYVDTAAMVPARADYGGQAAAARVHEPVGAVPEVRSPQPGGFMPGHKEHGPSGSAARPGDPFAGFRPPAASAPTSPANCGPGPRPVGPRAGA